MTVSTTTNVVVYTGPQSATLPVPFRFNQSADLVVETLVVATGAITTLVLGSDYTTQGAGLPTGGTITLTAGSLPSGETITIARDPAEVQDTSLPNGSPYFGSTLEGALDLLTMEVQALRTLVNLSLKLPLVEALQGINTSMPPGAQRANFLQGYDSSGNPALIAGSNASSQAVTATGSTTPRLLANRFADTVNALDFGANNFGAVDNITAFTALAAYVNGLAIVNSDPIGVFLPRGEYLYSGGLSFTRPVVIFGNGDATLNYTGSAAAVTMGPAGLTGSNYLPHQNYNIVGITLTGGSSMTSGIFFQNYITAPRVINCRFYNFGNASAYGVFFQSNNWDSFISQCQWYTTAAGPSSNWIQVSGYLSATPDNGASRLRVDTCLASHQAAAGIGIWLNGTASQITNSKIEGFAPNVRFGSWSNSSTIGDSYFEIVRNGACFEYGDLASGQQPNAFIAGITVHDCFVNVHNTDLSTTAYVAAPTAGNTTTGLQSSAFIDNIISNLATTREMVHQTTNASQTGNTSSGNRGVTLTHNLGGSIVAWGGGQGENPSFQPLTASDLFAQFTAGGSSSAAGLQFNNKALTTYLQMYLTSTGVFIVNDNGNESFRIQPSTGLAQFSNLGIYAQKLSSAAANGEIFEEADGNLYYKNLAGTVGKLSN